MGEDFKPKPDSPDADQMSEILEDVGAPLEEVELLLFLLDGSGSMSSTSTHDGKTKVDHLVDVMEALLSRLKEGSQAARFRVQAVYFASDVKPDSRYETIDDFVLRNPRDVVGGLTAIARSMDAAKSILDHFKQDETLPAEKYATVFLITDGHETEGGDVNGSAASLMNHQMMPILACVGVGSDADESLLIGISSEVSERQLRHLGDHQLLHHMPDQTKLYLRGHEQDRITTEVAEALRRFVYVLSSTAKSND